MSVLIYVVTYIYIYICIHICIRIYIFLLCQPFALQSCSRNCYPAPDLVCFKPDSARVLLSGGVFFSQTPVSEGSGHRKYGRFD